MLRKLLLLVVIISTTAAATDLYKDCGSPNAELTLVEFTPPCEKHACILRRGEQITVKAHFVPKIPSKQILVTAYQTEESYFHMETILVQGDNLCGRHNISCPLVPDETQYAYVTGMVPQTMPHHKTTFRLVFTGDNNQRLFCKTCPIEIR